MAADEGRQLTAKELERKAAYEKISEGMASQGYQRRELTVGVVRANVMAILIMLPFIAPVVGIGALIGVFSEMEVVFWQIAAAYLFFLGLIVAHEGIHGLTWALFAKNHFRSISFGVIWSMLTPYCHCSEPLKRWQYILGGLMPTMVLGFGLAAVALVLRMPLLVFVAVMMIVGGGGDFYIIFKMLCYHQKSKDAFYYDHPYECGVVVFER